MTKKCNRCKNELDASKFHRNKANKDGLNNRCAKCTVEYNNERYHKNDNLKIYQRAYAKANKTRLKKYGITVSQYEQMLENQNNSCAICLKSFGQVYVDHCHATGKVRGLLCLKCNTGIGLLEDSVENLKNAISYLEL